ncbi:hypothetical protein Enr8_34250 [Blastopirellula retiformator]|uniref:Uncharacterized protein n=1 Tax=Blastopirellula retiformator TaxID=2527970 RepID=A0A5C5V0M4_9BACT|nr:hypothetical protein Enr8_34250 [Blastopirellula retiformator]
MSQQVTTYYHGSFGSPTTVLYTRSTTTTTVPVTSYYAPTPVRVYSPTYSSSVYPPVYNSSLYTSPQPVLYLPVEKCPRRIFQPRQAQSIALRGSQNNDLRRCFGVARPISTTRRMAAPRSASRDNRSVCDSRDRSVVSLTAPYQLRKRFRGEICLAPVFYAHAWRWGEERNELQSSSSDAGVA